MSEILNAALAALQTRIGDDEFDGSIRIDIEGEGSLRIDASGASIDASDADCTLEADAETFQGMLEGDVDPTTAFMTGKLKVDGDMGQAMKLGSLLS